MSIVVLGAVFVDIKGYPASVYIPGGRNEGRIVQVHGGVARNIAENIARLGLHSRLVSLVDHTVLGDEVMEKLRRSGVDTRFIRRAADGMGCWLAVFDHRGDVAASISKRPVLSPLANILDEEGDGVFSGAESILLELDLEEAVLARVFRIAKQRRLPVYAAVSNISIAAARRGYLPSVDCLICNRKEAGVLFQEDYTGRDALELPSILARRISEAGIPRMVMTLGSDGAVYADLQGAQGYCPAIKGLVMDTAGAGDAFFSGCAAALSSHQPLEEACRAGARLAAAVISTRENATSPLLR